MAAAAAAALGAEALPFGAGGCEEALEAAPRAASAGGGGHPPLEGQHPLEDRRMLRLVLISGCTLVFSGIASGMGLSVQLFVEAGVGSSMCAPGVNMCDKQFIFVSHAFNSAVGVAGILQLFAGWLFDRVGGRAVSKVAAALVALGFLLLQIPLRGAQLGQDARTSGWLAVALLIADTGAFMSTIAGMAMVWHFYDLQTFVSALAGSAMNAAALVPMLLSAIVRWTRWPLSSIMLAWLALVVLAGVCCHYTVPSLTEYRRKAESVLGATVPLAGRSSSWQMLLDGHAVLWRHGWLHALAVVALGSGLGWGMLYASLLGDWGKMLFGSAGAGEKLGLTYNLLTGVGGAVLAPAAAYVGDSVGQGTGLMLAGMVVLSAITSLIVPQPTWSAQVVTCASNSLFLCLGNAFLLAYVLAYAGPVRFGVVNGLLGVYVSLMYLALQGLVYKWISSLSGAYFIHLSLPLQATSIFGTVVLAAWAAQVLYWGLPAKPVTLAKDEEALPLRQ